MALTTLPPALAGLAAYPQFVLYRLVPNGDKMDKEPVNWRTGQLPPKGQGGSGIWATFDTVAAIAPLFGPSYGVGFSFAESDPFWFLDIDKCLQPDNTWSPLALQLCAQLKGAAIEISQSGRGLHVIGTGAVPAHGCANKPLGLEFYHTGRFVALTGAGAMGDVLANLTQPIHAVVSQYFPASAISAIPTDWTTEPCADWRGPADDDELIRRMFAAKPSTSAMFGGRASFADLWNANEIALTTTYPDPTRADGCGYSRNAADMALATHLAWWTGRDMERIRRLMLRSALRRDKWDRDDYLPKFTIPRAVAVCTTVYRERQPDTAPSGSDDSDAVEPTTHTGRLANGHTIVNAEDQLKLWAGFTYVTDSNTILTATGQSLDQSQFKNRFGGSLFVLDQDKMTDNAWDAFTHSRVIRMPKVDHSAFRPDLDPSDTWESDGESFVNTYRRIRIPRQAGDVAPFLEHLAKLLPNERDRSIMLSYMAGVVQYPGVKFQWAPFIQGVKGNGKTMLSLCVAEAVGWRYTHTPRVAEIVKQFNGWQLNKIFIMLEDIYYPDGQTEIEETIKPMITGKRQPIRGMQRTERTMDVCANWIVNSNHKTGIRLNKDERRWAPLFTAQQSKDDLARDGMTETYFKRLYSWLENGGYAIVAEFLNTFQIPAEFGLDCLKSRAPLTSVFDEAVAAGLGRVEQEVQEAVAQGLPGFANGWVSSLALDKLLRDNRMEVICPRAKRAGVLEALGYIHHPALRNGRSTACLPGTRDRPVFFIKKGAQMGSLQTSQEIIQAYLAAQAPGVMLMEVAA